MNPKEPLEPFDLNYKNNLPKDWTTSDAFQEIIANALDEKIIHDGPDDFLCEDNCEDNKEKYYLFQDKGDGLEYNSFAQGVNNKKVESDKPLIGRYGQSLVKSLCLFYNKGIHLEIFSKDQKIQIVCNKKSNSFPIETLKLKFLPSDEYVKGTLYKFQKKPCIFDENNIREAKSRFLFFNKLHLLGRCEYGEVYEKETENYIFINGLLSNNKQNKCFLFNYNIIVPNNALKKNKNIASILSNLNRKICTDYYSKFKRTLVKIIESTSKKSKEIMQKIVTCFKNKDKSIVELGWEEVKFMAVNNLKENGFLFGFKIDNVSRKILEEKCNKKDYIEIDDGEFYDKIKKKSLPTVEKFVEDYISKKKSFC